MIVVMIVVLLIIIILIVLNPLPSPNFEPESPLFQVLGHNTLNPKP